VENEAVRFRIVKVLPSCGKVKKVSEENRSLPYHVFAGAACEISNNDIPF